MRALASAAVGVDAREAAADVVRVLCEMSAEEVAEVAWEVASEVDMVAHLLLVATVRSSHARPCHTANTCRLWWRTSCLRWRRRWLRRGRIWRWVRKSIRAG